MKIKFHSRVIIRLIILAILSTQCNAAFSKVILPRLISDGIVLQRNKAINIWGWADEGEKIKVSFFNKTYSAITGADKIWMVVLNPQKEGGPYTMNIEGTNSITINNILIGDVWLCSGQSNMEYKMERSKQRYPEEIASSQNNFIRQFVVKSSVLFKEQNDVTSTGWIAASPETILNFTAVGYFFAKEIYDKYKIPIGLINSSIGGTPAEAWISEEGLQKLPSYLNKYHYYQNPENLKKDEAYNQRYQDSLKALGRKNPPLFVKRNHIPVVLYNTMIAPLTSFSFKGILWYQGEANTGDPYVYRELLPALIKDWRKKLHEPSLPFIYVQLANYGKPSTVPEDNDVAMLRESQSVSLKVPNTGMAVIHDAGEADYNIHPTDKKTVGYRLSLIARKMVYGEKYLVSSGPVFKSMKIDGKKILLNFSNIGGGLMTNDGKDPKYFSIAGADKKFTWAKAKIEGNTVVVWSDEIAKPVAVRYAWATNPLGANLYNKEGLPASLFRTDKWNTGVAVDNENNQ